MLSQGVIDESFCNFYFENASDTIFKEAIKTIPYVERKAIDANI